MSDIIARWHHIIEQATIHIPQRFKAGIEIEIEMER
jgi:hypothetical protein